MNLSKEIQELVNEKVISNEIAEKIQAYYANKQTSSTNKLFIVFGILGAILIGLGIILILAHNWDNLSIPVKTSFAFIPLIIGQFLCGFTLLKKNNNTTWVESSSAFLFFAVGASMALISQIYNIPGNLGSFILTWMLLCLPIIYLLKSSIVSLLYIIEITYYACKIGYWEYPHIESYNYWLLFLAILPYYYQLYLKKPKSNFMVFHNWFIPLSLIISLGIVSNNFEELMYIPYFSLFGAFYLIGESPIFKGQKSINNSFKILGSLGTIIMLLMLSFNWYWDDLISVDPQFNLLEDFSELIAAIVLTALTIVLIIKQFKNVFSKNFTLNEIVFLLFIPIFLVGFNTPYLSIIIINSLLFSIGILTIRKGAKNNHLGILNYGLLIITALVICRFFDTDLSFVIRGLLFVSVGVGFFIANYWMLKKRKTHEK